jgi:hypothetical protein
MSTIPPTRALHYGTFYVADAHEVNKGHSTANNKDATATATTNKRDTTMVPSKHLLKTEEEGKK